MRRCTGRLSRPIRRFAIEAVFEAGLNIEVPLLVVDEAVQEAADLPPWKRQA
jgi:hypothetical protein